MLGIELECRSRNMVLLFFSFELSIRLLKRIKNAGSMVHACAPDSVEAGGKGGQEHPQLQ